MRRALALLALLGALAPPAAAKEEPLRPGTVLHLASRRHSRPYSLFVPAGRDPRASRPLVISSHGRGGTGRKEIGAWTGLAKELGFVVACPDMCTATVDRPPTSGLPAPVEDDEVVLSIVEELSERLRVNRRAVMITGFSGGGNPSYYTGLRHPDLFTHICTRGGNFGPQQIPTDEAVLAAGRKRLRIYIFYGEFDHPLILGREGKPGQAEMARAALAKAGYEHVRFERIPGMKHESRPRLAAEWFGAYLRENRKRFAAGDQVDALISKAREAIGKRKYRDALRSLGRAEGLERKSGLEPLAVKEKERLNEVGAKMVERATEAHAAGEIGEALKILGRVARDFRGLPAAGEARRLTKEWKP